MHDDILRIDTLADYWEKRAREYEGQAVLWRDQYFWLLRIMNEERDRQKAAESK